MKQAQHFSKQQELDWLAPSTREALRLASEEASQLHSPRVYPEHLFLGLLKLEQGPLKQLTATSTFSLARVRKQVQARCGPSAEVVDAEQISLSDEAQECLQRAVAALVADPPQAGIAKQVSPELLALSLFAHPRVQPLLVTIATLALLIHTRLVEQVGKARFQRVERRFLLTSSPKQAEQVALQYVTVGKQRRILKSVEPPYYRFRDLALHGPVHRDLQSLISLLNEARSQPTHSRGLLLIEHPGKHLKQLVRAMAGEAETPLTMVFCPVLVELWQEDRANQQATSLLRELFLSLRLLSTGLIYLDGLDTLAAIDGAQEEQEPGEHTMLFWPIFFAEIDKLLLQPGIVLLATVQKPEVLPPALLKSERLGQGMVIDGSAIVLNKERSATPADQQQPERVNQRACPMCQQFIQPHWLHCVYCGTLLTQRCIQCGAAVPEIAGARFCFQCGHQFLT